MQPSETQLVVARLLDIFHRTSPWHRRLWRVGVILGLREVLEYGTAVQEGGLRDEGLRYVCDSAKREIAIDTGIGSELTQHLTQALDATKLKTSQGRNILSHLIARVEADYLPTWRKEVVKHGIPDVERTARALASHLLDSDLSPDHLHRWLTAVKDPVIGDDAEALVAEAERVHGTAYRGYEALIPFASLSAGSSEGIRVLSSEETSAWITSRGLDASGIRYQNSLLLSLEAKDPWSAVEQVTDLVSRLQARWAVGHSESSRPRASGAVFISGKVERFRLAQPRRQVAVHAVSRQGALYEIKPYSASRVIDDALELVAAMETGPPGAAISGGWAAIEGLLAPPGEMGPHAADRLASLTVCSYPRAELTRLSYQAQPDEPLASSLQQAGSNHERASLVEAWIAEGNPLRLEGASDLAAERRMRLLINDPQPVLARVRQYMSETFRRLYNQRNIVMHAGSLASVAMRATLRTAPPLVGAGLDRLVHASLETPSVEPLALVARAEIELDLVGTPAGRRLADLLE